MSVGETVPAEVVEEHILDEPSRELIVWDEVEEGLLDTVRELGGIAAEASFRLEADGKPTNGVRLTALLDHISRQVRELRQTIEPSESLSPVDDLLQRLRGGSSSNGTNGIAHHTNGTNGNGKPSDESTTQDWKTHFSDDYTYPGAPAHSNGNGSHANGSTPPEEVNAGENNDGLQNGSVTEKETSIISISVQATGSSDSDLKPEEELGVSDESTQPALEPLKLTDREKIMLQIISDTVPVGEWFSSQSLDFSGLNFASRNALNQAFSQLKYKLTTNGLMQVTGETKARRYLLVHSDLEAPSELDDEDLDRDLAVETPLSNSSVDDHQVVEELPETEQISESTHTKENETQSTVSESTDPFEAYTTKLLEPEIPSRMEIGAKPQIIVLADNKIKIGDEMIELSAAETAVVNMLLHHRTRLKIVDMFDLMGNPEDNAFRNEFKGALHKLNNLFESLLGEGTIEREGHTKAMTYRLSLTSVIADLRPKAKPGGTPDFLAQVK